MDKIRVKDAKPKDIITNGSSKYEIVAIIGDAVAYKSLAVSDSFAWMNINYFKDYWVIDTKKEDIDKAIEILKKYGKIIGGVFKTNE